MKRRRTVESSASDTDADLTTPKRYVRKTLLKTSPARLCANIAVVIPPSNIDKSLYALYLPRSLREQVVADLDFESSSCHPADQDQSRPEALETPKTTPRKACRIPGSNLVDESE
jgi:hypothetical protein